MSARLRRCTLLVLRETEDIDRQRCVEHLVELTADERRDGGEETLEDVEGGDDDLGRDGRQRDD